MSMKKFTKKMLAIVAAGAMTMGLAMPTSVFAAEGDTTTKVTEAYISKTYKTEVGKSETFSFEATPVAGSTNGVTIPDISFTDSETGSTTKRAKVSFPEWTDAGKYEYTVKETAATPAITDEEHQKMIMSQAEYTMDVYVSNGDNGLEISNIIVNKKKDDKGEVATGKVDISDTDNNGFNFTNTYVQEAGTGTDPINPDPAYATDGSLKVTKAINANGGTVDAEKAFDFTATFTFPEGTDATTLGGVKDANGNIITIKQDGTYTFNLKANGNMKFTGVPVGTKISVEESATQNYKGSVESTFNGVAQPKREAAKYDEAIAVTNTLGQKQNKVDVTNTYNYVPTTGIIMNTLPYVLMVALCAAALFGFVAFKRKKVQK